MYRENRIRTKIEQKHAQGLENVKGVKAVPFKKKQPWTQWAHWDLRGRVSTCLQGIDEANERGADMKEVGKHDCDIR